MTVDVGRAAASLVGHTLVRLHRGPLPARPPNPLAGLYRPAVE